jgi:hypothetical protein
MWLARSSSGVAIQRVTPAPAGRTAASITAAATSAGAMSPSSARPAPPVRQQDATAEAPDRLKAGNACEGGRDLRRGIRRAARQVQVGDDNDDLAHRRYRNLR